MATANDRAKRPNRLPHRIAFIVVAALLFGILLLLPMVLAGVVQDIAQSANPTYRIVTSGQGEASSHANINLAVENLDEWQRKITIVVAGHHICQVACDWTDRILFVSIPVAAEDGEGLPPSVTLNFPAGIQEVSQEITLPVSGDAIRYPFDTYGLELGVIMQRVYSDGHIQVLSPRDADGHLFLSVNGSIPRAVMQKPLPVDLNGVFVDDPAFQYVNVTQLFFSRPIYLRIMTVLLVLLISAAAAYAVFMRPLDELVINCGALVLGVWGIRAIMFGSAMEGFTVIDLMLMTVIIFLLMAIVWHALAFHHERGGLNLPLLRRRQTGAPEQTAIVPSGAGDADLRFDATKEP